MLLGNSFDDIFFTLQCEVISQKYGEQFFPKHWHIFLQYLIAKSCAVLIIFLRIVLSKLFFFHVVLNTYLIDFSNLHFLFCSIFLSMFSKSLHSGNFDAFFHFL